MLPDCNIKNFTSDWNNGINLSALLDYCRPGLMPHWQRLNPSNGADNVRRAMEIAEREFRIPLVLEPEHFASPHLDELSGMTYLSYFMKEEDSPGYYSTLNWVKNQIPNFRINNFRVSSEYYLNWIICLALSLLSQQWAIFPHSCELGPSQSSDDIDTGSPSPMMSHVPSCHLTDCQHHLIS